MAGSIRITNDPWCIQSSSVSVKENSVIDISGIGVASTEEFSIEGELPCYVAAAAKTLAL